MLARGHQVLHILLDADESTLRARIDADPTGTEPSVRGWRHDHVEIYEASRAWLLGAADLVIDTGSQSAAEVAHTIATHIKAQR